MSHALYDLKHNLNVLTTQLTARQSRRSDLFDSHNPGLEYVACATRGSNKCQNSIFPGQGVEHSLRTISLRWARSSSEILFYVCLGMIVCTQAAHTFASRDQIRKTRAECPVQHDYLTHHAVDMLTWVILLGPNVATIVTWKATSWLLRGVLMQFIIFGTTYLLSPSWPCTSLVS